jgi:hypothetical protein
LSNDFLIVTQGDMRQTHLIFDNRRNILDHTS